jgi:O-antigen/teichoic acid export membrane protein
MESSLRVTNLFAMPCAIGIAVLAYPIFNVFFPNSNEAGPVILAILGVSS